MELFYKILLYAYIITGGLALLGVSIAMLSKMDQKNIAYPVKYFFTACYWFAFQPLAFLY